MRVQGADYGALLSRKAGGIADRWINNIISEVLPMRTIRFMLCTLVPLLAVFPLSAYADSFSCKGGIVSLGDDSVTLFAKCGPPDVTESHIEEVIHWIDRDAAEIQSQENIADRKRHRDKQIVYITVTTVTYNLGPDQLIRIITLRNGKIAEIRTGSYGYTKP